MRAALVARMIAGALLALTPLDGCASARQASLQEAVRKAVPAPVSAGTDRVSVAWTALSQAADLDPHTVWVATQNTWSLSAASLGSHHFIVTRAVVDQANRCVLWGLIAHELAHDLLRHADRATTTADVLSVVGTAAGAVVPGGGLAVAGAGTLGLPAYSRSQEAEADQRAIAILRAAGKPEWALRYTLEQLRRISPPEPSGWLATHPALDERIASQPAFDTEAAYQVCSPPVNQCRYDLATGQCVYEDRRR